MHVKTIAPPPQAAPLTYSPANSITSTSSPAVPLVTLSVTEERVLLNCLTTILAGEYPDTVCLTGVLVAGQLVALCSPSRPVRLPVCRQGALLPRSTDESSLVETVKRWGIDPERADVRAGRSQKAVNPDMAVFCRWVEGADNSDPLRMERSFLDIFYTLTSVYYIHGDLCGNLNAIYL